MSPESPCQCMQLLAQIVCQHMVYVPTHGIYIYGGTWAVNKIFNKVCTGWNKFVGGVGGGKLNITCSYL